MRAGWQQEIEKMPLDRAHVSQLDQSQNALAVSKSPNASRKQIKKLNDDMRDALEAHRAQLKPLVGRGDAKLRELRDKEAQLRAGAREQLDKLQSWNRIGLVRIFRRLAILQLMHILVSRVILQRKIQLVSAKLDEITKLIALTKTAQNVVLLPADVCDRMLKIVTWPTYQGYFISAGVRGREYHLFEKGDCERGESRSGTPSP